MTTNKKNNFDKNLLKILACPVALTMDSKSKDPGKLKLYKNSWLVSEVSQYKYPILDGVPILLKDVGQKWEKTKIKDLPTPPPSDY